MSLLDDLDEEARHPVRQLFEPAKQDAAAVKRPKKKGGPSVGTHIDPTTGLKVKRQDTWKAEPRTVRESVGDQVRDFREGSGVAGLAGSLVPGAGETQSLAQTFDNIKDGKLGTAGLSALGMIPMVGAIKKVGKAAAKEAGEMVKLYHATDATLPSKFARTSASVNSSTFGDLPTVRHGASFTDNPEVARGYGKNLGEYTVPSAKPATINRDTMLDFADSLDPFGKDRELWLTAKNTRQPWQMFEGETGQRFSEWLRSKGYDSARFAEEVPSLARTTSNAPSGTTTVSLYPERITPSPSPISSLSDSEKAANPLQSLVDRHPAADIDIDERRGVVILHNIKVPKAERGRGIGSAFMNDLVEWADQNGKRLALTPENEKLGGSKERLKKWYRSFGFKKRTDYSISESMTREPRKSGGTAAVGLANNNQDKKEQP